MSDGAFCILFLVLAGKMYDDGEIKKGVEYLRFVITPLFKKML